MASGNKAAIRSALVSLVQSTTLFVQVYGTEPRTMMGQSPCAWVDMTAFETKRYTFGAGRHHEKSTWTVTVSVDNLRHTPDQAAAQLDATVDALCALLNQHVQLGLTGSAILVAGLDGQTSRVYSKVIEGTQYRCFDLRLTVTEDYTTPVST